MGRIQYGSVDGSRNNFSFMTYEGEPGLVFGIKKSSGLSSSELKGRYLVVYTDDEIDPPGQADAPWSSLMESAEVALKSSCTPSLTILRPTQPK